MSQLSLPIYFCAWPGCTRSKLRNNGLCGRDYLRAEKAGILDQFTDPRRVGRICEGCDGPIPASVQAGATTCSRNCNLRRWTRANAEHNRREKRRWYEQNLEDHRQRAAAFYAANTERVRANVVAWQERNPDKRRAHNAASNARRRMLVDAAFVDRPDERFVWDRDEGICWICDRPVDPSLRHPDPGSRSMDHVIPLAAGGVHGTENVALAHLGCNAAKQEKILDKVPRWWPSAQESASVSTAATPMISPRSGQRQSTAGCSAPSTGLTAV